MDTIDVALVTWPNHPRRLEYFRCTVACLKLGLTASSHRLRYVCSAESEPDRDRPWCGDQLEEVCALEGIELHWRGEDQNIPPKRFPRANLGANMNAALKLCTSEVILLVQDDWRLLYPLDLSPGAHLLTEPGFQICSIDYAHPPDLSQVDLVRYSWPDVDGMRPTFHEHQDGFPRINVTGRWPYGDDPHLRRRDFMDRWGWYREGGGHGSASADLMARLKRGRANIAAADRCYFRHHGDVTAVINDTRNRRIKR